MYCICLGRRQGNWKFGEAMEKHAMFLMLITLAVCVAEKPDVRPLNIAHRGSSGRLPEHTLAAYRYDLITRVCVGIMQLKQS